MSLRTIILLLLALQINFCLSQSQSEVQPLALNSRVPDANIFTVAGEPIQLSSILQNKKVILVFYRGGWCPYCRKHLASLQEAQTEIIEKGYQIIALSADKFDKSKRTSKKIKMEYEVYSDYYMEAAKAFGICFKMDEETYRNYRHLQLINPKGDEEEKGKIFDLLPVPSVFIISDNEVKYSYANPDYKFRLSKEEILQAIQKVENTN